MFALPGYQFIAKIYESATSLIYRGYRESDKQPVIFKLLKENYPSPAELTKYKQEYEITKSLNVDGVVKAYSMQKYQNNLVIILEDFGGDSLSLLKEYIINNLRLEEIILIFISIAQILGEVQAKNIIHKDINPSNIVFNFQTKQVKIIDFGISTKLSSENPTLKNPQILEGTLPYMSPEQTGRMNRYLDYRTDFYSLGATFYELLTHQLPFNSSDALELVHCHLAKQPIPPQRINPQIPKPISDIVMKLLAKTAEERYQSAYGIKADLEKCLQQYRNGKISEFTLGSEDIYDKFQIPQKLYGREKEIEALLKGFDRIAKYLSGAGEKNNLKSKIEIMLVTGYSGIGKSALVQELYKPITQQRGYFLSGKFDRLQRNIPYSAIVKAFGSLIGQILTESESQLNQWKEKLGDALGANAQVIIDVIPGVELIIGKQTPVQELGAVESQNRFNLVFQNFIRVFCQKEHPLAIFLDDLQWADSASLKLIELIARDNELGYLLLIGSYRDNEVDATHPTTITLEGLRKEGVVINQITLAPLSLENVTQLIADSLQGNLETVKPLGELVLRKTGGNPFFINQFLKKLEREKLLTFQQGRCWQWNIAQIEEMGITDNVVDLMISNLRQLPDSTQQVLRLAACIGSSFDLNTLSIIYEESASETFEEVLPAIQEGLLLPLSELSIREEDLINSSLLIENYKFLHDRVQQAAYSLIDEDKKRATHIHIGRLILGKIPPSELETRIFEVVDHLNLGRGAIADRPEKIKLAQLNLEAGKKSKYAAAYAAAKQYLEAGIDCLEGNFWLEHYELAFPLHKELADVEYLNQNFERSKKLIDLLLSQAKTAIEKVEIYSLTIVQYTVVGKPLEAIQTGRNALQLLGVNLPEVNLGEAFTLEIDDFKKKLLNREIESLIDRPEMTNLEQIAIAKVMFSLLAPAYFLQKDLLKLLIAKTISISLQYGNCVYSSNAYLTYGFFLTMEGEYQLAYELGTVGLKICDRFNDLSIKPRSYMIFGTNISPWKKPLNLAYAALNEGVKAGLAGGDFQTTGYIFVRVVMTLFSMGKTIPHTLEEVDKFLKFTRKTKNEWPNDAIMAFQLTLSNLAGQTKGKLSFDGNEVSSEEYLLSCQERGNFQAICFYQLVQLTIYCLYDNFSEALKLAESISKQYFYIADSIIIVEYNFYYSLTLAALYPTADEADKQQYWHQLEVNQKQMKVWADNCPENFSHTYLLIVAEMARISGRDLEAIDLYDRAIESARENEFTQYEALGNELAAKFWLRRGKQDFAQIYLKKALYCYEIWGAKPKVEDLLEKYPHLLAEKVTCIADPVNNFKHTSTNTKLSSLDLETVMKATQAISGEIVLDKLLASLMKIIIENAGASKGSLILGSSGKLLIEAEASVDFSDIVVQQSIPVEDSCNLPVTLINYVRRTQSPVVLTHAATTGKFTRDPYIAANNLKSILCSPIINQGKLIAVLYLENNLTVGAFNSERIEILKILSSQAAISLENALLYANLTAAKEQLEEYNYGLQQRVEERTQELKAKEATLAEAQKLAHLGSWEWDIVNQKVIWSQEAYRIFGLNPNQPEPSFSEYLEMVYPDDRTSLKETLEFAIESGKDYEIDYRIIRFDGSVRYIYAKIQLTLDESGKVSKVFGTLLDITDRKLAEEALRQSEARYRAIVQDQTELICRFQSDGILTFVNDAYCRYFNKQRQALIGNNFRSSIYSEDVENLERHLVSLSADNPVGTIEYRVFVAGHLWWHQWTVRAIFDRTGQFIEFQAVGQDITDRKKAEEALRESEATLRDRAQQLTKALQELKRTQSQLIQTEKMSSLGQMVAGIAHEINNPISFIYGNLMPASEYVQDLLNLIELYQQAYPHPTPEVESAIEELDLEFVVKDLEKLMSSMRNGADRIRNIVLSLRNFSRLDEADMKPVDIHEGIESTLLILQHRLKQDKTAGSVDILLVKEYGKLPKVTCYASQLNQVLMNIISNAIDALGLGIGKNFAESKVPTIWIRTEVTDTNAVQIRIADNGPGMTEQVRQKAFDPFFTTKPVGSGTGLGLNISYQIVVDSHSGKLSCVSEPEKGAEFIIEIPIAQQKTPKLLDESLTF